MRIVIFTGTKNELVHTWLLNELDVLKQSEFKFLLPYVVLSNSNIKQIKANQYNNAFIYISRLRINIFVILKLIHNHFLMLFFHPTKYMRLFIFIMTHYNWPFLKNFLKSAQIFKELKKFNPDIIYTHFTGDQYILAFLASKFFGKKFGLFLHSTYKYSSFISYLHQHADFIIVKSDYLKKDYLKRYPDILPQKITVLPWGIDTEFFRPDTKILKQVQDDKKDSGQARMTILSISRFVEMKGLIYLLQACKLLVAENIKFKCILVGYGSLKSVYQKFIDRNKLNEYVKIYPPIPHSVKLKRLLTTADVFVLPAVIDERTDEQDFIPNAVLEAMAMEKVVITTKVTGMQEAAKDSESIFFTKGKDPIDLANKIKMVMELSEEKKKQMGRKAREIVVKYYDKGTQGKKFVEFLKSQIQENED